MSEMTFDEIWASIDDVDGWLTEGQARALYDAARACEPGGCIVEIGSFRGRSTIILASAAPADVEIVAIDPHAGNDRGPQEIDGYEDAASEDHEQFEKNLRAAGVRDRVRHVRQFSSDVHDAVGDRIDLLYIDGAHRFGPAHTDIQDWGRRVTAGGVMAIHDSFSSIGVTGAILVELVTSPTFRYVGRSRSLAIYRADLPTGHRARATNAARQLAQLGWFARNIALKVLLTAGLGRVLHRLGRPVPDWPY